MGVYRRGNIYYVSVYIEGRRIRKRVGTNKKRAMEIERELKKKINRGEYRSVSVQITLSSLSAEYLVY